MNQSLADLLAACARYRSIVARMKANIANTLADPLLLREEEVVRGALTVALSGTLEAFVRETAKEYCTEVESRKLTFASLPVAMQEAILMDGGELASKRAQDSGHVRWIRATPADMYARVASMNARSVTLLWEAFARTDANPDYKVFKELLKRFDVSQPGEALQGALGATAGLIPPALTTLMAKRNAFAHEGYLPDVPTADAVEEYCERCETLCRAVISLLRWRLHQPPFAVNIERATGSELSKIDGIGAKVARAIVDNRNQNGPFRTVDSLLRVDGIGTAKMAKIRKYVCTEPSAGVFVGNTVAQVTAGWGQPLRRAQRNVNGAAFEDWHYGVLETKVVTIGPDGRVAKAMYGPVPTALAV